MKTTDRFLEYVKINTASDPDSTNAPSTKIQFTLAESLKKEMNALGLTEVTLSDQCVLFGSLPATPGYEKVPAIGFIAHMDTSPDFSGEGVSPQIIPDYDGKNVPLGKSGKVLSVKNFPRLKKLKGCTLITTDGTTLLGADDKAGIAEIMTACEEIIEKKIPHGKIRIGFTPDEEVGRGTENFDIQAFGADYAYTLDGDEEGTINFENFNACAATFEIHGVNVHPGSAKNIMVNAALIACEINQMLPSGEIPSKTENYEGFYHLCDIAGDVEKATLKYIVRDHSKEIFHARKESLKLIEKLINEKYGKGTVKLTLKDQYENMAAVFRKNPEPLNIAKQAIKNVGLKPVTAPIRGGTDGARLSLLGLPCPNLCTGGFGFHGPYEHITKEGLEICTRIIIEIVKIAAEKQ
ncbi:MAG TPA: peptidase T [Flexilinea sp.]|nr:peptidase T [Flexilinea sp.]